MTGNEGKPSLWPRWRRSREPLREAAHALLAEAQATSGDVVGALRTIDALRRRLRDETGLDPSGGDPRPGTADSARGSRARPGTGRPPIVRLVRPSWVWPSSVGTPNWPRSWPRSGRRRQVWRWWSGRPEPGSPAFCRRRRRAVPNRSSPSRAFQAERNEPWSLARTLLREALSLDLAAAGVLAERTATALADLLPELEELRPLSADAIDPESRRALALEGAVRLLSSVAAEGLFLAVDDLQWADPTSLLLLGVIGRRVPDAALALSYRPDEVTPDSPLPALLDDLGCSPVGDRRHHRAVLSGHALRTRHRPGPGGILGQTHRRDGPGGVGGHPAPRRRWGDRFRRRRTMAAAPGRRRRSGRDRRPGGAAAGHRAACGAPASGERETLALLALLGREAPARLLARARSCEETVVLDELDALAQAGLTRLGDAGWATAHDLIAESVAATLGREERGRLHHRLARALTAAEEDPAEVARHLAEAGDPAAAAEAFAAAAVQRMERYAADETAALADAGLALQPAGATRFTLLEHRAEARNIRGDGVGARHDLRCALDELGPGLDRSRLLAKLAILSVSQDAAEASALAEAAMAEAGNDTRAKANTLVSAGFAVGVSDRTVEAEFSSPRRAPCSRTWVTPGGWRVRPTPRPTG